MGKGGGLWEAGSLSLMQVTPACYIYSPRSPAVSPEVITPQPAGAVGDGRKSYPALLARWCTLVWWPEAWGRAGGKADQLQTIQTVLSCGQVPGLLHGDLDGQIWAREPERQKDNVESLYFSTESSPF